MKALLVGGPADGEARDEREALGELLFVPEKSRLGFVRAEDTARLLTERLRVHVYERERIDGHPTLGSRSPSLERFGQPG